MGQASDEGAYDSEFSGFVQLCFGVPTSVRKAIKSIHAWRGSTDGSGGTSPSVEGLPRQGRGEAGKGRGPKVAQQRLGRSARSALRVPRQITEKGRPWGQPFSVIWRREGDCRVHPCTRSRCALRLGTRLRRSGSAPAEPSNPGVASHHPSHPPDKRKRATLWAALLRLSGGERGIRTPEARFRRLHTFQACSFNHSDTSPDPCHRQTPQQGRRF